MSKIVRLSNTVAIEFGEVTSISVQESGLYFYDFGNLQILNADSFKWNNRNIAYSVDLQRTLLRTTPYPYVDEKTHEFFNRKEKYKNLSLNYIKCKLLFAAGFDFTNSEWGIASSIFVELDNGKKLYLNSVFDEKTNSKIQPISEYRILENVTFNQGFEIYVLDCFSIINSVDPALLELKKELFGNTQTISNYKIEFSIIENTEVIDFEENDKPFKKLSPSDFYIQYYQQDSSEIYNTINLTSENAIFLQLQHTAYDLKSYFKKICNNDGSLFSVKHQLDIQVFDKYNNNVRTISTTHQNTEDSFNGVTIRPFLPSDVFELNDVDHVLLVLTSYFNDALSNISLSRKTSLVVEDLSLFQYIQFKLELEKVIVKNEITKLENKVSVKSDIPSVVKVPVNYYYKQFDNSIITLSPYNNTVKIKIPSGLSETLYLCIGTNKYQELQKDNEYVIFSIPGLEYFKKEEKYYIVNTQNEMISYGDIELI